MHTNDHASLDQSQSENNHDSTARTCTYNSELKTFAILLLTIKMAYNLSGACVQAILLLFQITLKMMVRVTNMPNVAADELLRAFPKNEASLRKMAGTQKTGALFKTSVCCPQCFTLYPNIEDWVLYSHSKPDDHLCEHVEYPRHPHASRRTKCSTKLLKQLKTAKSTILRPLKVFPHQSLCISLQNILIRPGILKSCNEWVKRRSTDPTIMNDIYDGRVWQNFQTVNGRDFLALPNNIALSMNVDWFRPFEHSPYSIGVIYFVILNLPQNLRYKQDNIIVGGIIPGPHEPSKTLNTVLTPFVDDFLRLWQGIALTLPEPNLPVRIRAALLCVCCDVPACRKVCGFLGHNGRLACSKCNKPFPGNVQDGFDYSGYDVSSWPQRELHHHTAGATAVQQPTHQAERKRLESLHGLRYSILTKLPYFNVIQQHVIDPMHNLYMGIAKHTMNVWKSQGLLTQKDFTDIQKTVNEIEVPSDIGRIPSKIASGFSDFTADQWKHWILLYSTIGLKNRLPSENFRNWSVFVNACTLLSSPSLTLDAVNRGHSKLVEFCEGFQQLYGNASCTINMHLACHLKDCLLEF